MMKVLGKFILWPLGSSACKHLLSRKIWGGGQNWGCKNYLETLCVIK